MTYNIKIAKQAVLSDAIAAYYQIWQTDGIDTSFEEQLVLDAVFEVLDENTGSREQFTELLGLSYMLQGIRDRLKQRCEVRGAENGPEEDIPEGNRTYGDEEIPF